jgi:hypothetical protein
LIEFDSMINVRPSQSNRSRGVDDRAVKGQIRDIVTRPSQGPTRLILDAIIRGGRGLNGRRAATAKARK